MLGIGFRNRCGLRASEIAALARRAEDVGFEHLVHTEWNSDAIAGAIATAAVTRRARVWTGIANAGLRHPLMMAAAAAVADDVSGGRFVLGLGVGSRWLAGEARDTLEARPVAAMREYLAVVRAALAAERFDHAGPRFPLRGMERGFTPRAQRLPVYLAALGPRMLELAGEVADGAYVHMHGPEDVESLRARVDRGAERAGRDPRGCALAALLMAFVDDDVEAARAAARRTVAGYLAHDAYRRHVERLGYAAALPAVTRLLDRGEPERAAAAVPLELVDRVTAYGPGAACRARVRAYRDAGADVVVVSARPVREPAGPAGEAAAWRHAFERAIETFRPTAIA